MKFGYSCAHGCQFDQNEIDFTCTCPDGMELSDDMTNCQAKRVSNINAYEVINRSRFDDHHDHHNHDENTKSEPSK